MTTLFPRIVQKSAHCHHKMSKEKSTAAMSTLNGIIHQRVSEAEQQTLFQSNILDQCNHGIGSFILDLMGVSSDELLSVLKALFKFHASSTSLCLSTNIRDVLKYIESCSDTKNQLKLSVLEHLQKGLPEADVQGITAENVLVIGEYAASFVRMEDLEVSNAACVVLDKLMKLHHAQLIPIIYNYCHEHKTNSTVYLRFLTVFARAAAHSDEQFLACSELRVVDDLVALCKTNDVLLQINALELLVDIASTQSGLDYLCSRGVVQWLISVSIGESATHTPDPLISAEAMRVLGKVFERAAQRSFDFVGKVDPACVHHFLSTLVRYLEERDEGNRIGGLGIVSEFATISFSTLSLVVGFGEGRLVAEWLDLLNAAKPELIAAALHSVARVLYQDDQHYVQNNNATFGVFRGPPSAAADSKTHAESKSSEDLAAAVVDLKKRLVDGISTAKSLHYATYLLKVARIPVPSVRHAGVDLLTAISTNGWGLLALSSVHDTHAEGDFLAYLCERNTEFSKEGKDWKFSLIKAVAANPSRPMLGDVFNSRVDKLVEHGPYFMPARMADMMTI